MGQQAFLGDHGRCLTECGQCGPTAADPDRAVKEFIYMEAVGLTLVPMDDMQQSTEARNSFQALTDGLKSFPVHTDGAHIKYIDHAVDCYVESTHALDDMPRSRERRLEQQLSDGSLYDGEWFGSLRNGHGVIRYLDGARYEGQWLDDHYHGRGTYTITGHTYVGEWKDGQAHGSGSLTCSDGFRYDGEWLENILNGDGKEAWPNGTKFAGQYRHGLKTGAGIFLWPDGKKYQGQMLQNELSGDGTYTWTDGRKYEGQWVTNKMHGKGRFTWEDGKSYEGEYQENLKHGKGVFVYADGRRYDGKWELGKMHGVGMWCEQEENGGRRRKGRWSRGKFKEWLQQIPCLEKSSSDLDLASPRGQDFTSSQDVLMCLYSSESAPSPQITPGNGSAGILKSALKRQDTPTKKVSFAEECMSTPSIKSRRGRSFSSSPDRYGGSKPTSPSTNTSLAHKQGLLKRVR